MNERFINNINIIYDTYDKVKNDDYSLIAIAKSQKDAEIICSWLNAYSNRIRSLKLELKTHKHPLWSTREAERILNEKEKEIIELTDLLAEEVAKNGELLYKINNLQKELLLCKNKHKKEV